MGPKSGPYQCEDGRWGWRIVGDNNFDIVATDGGQGYENEAEATEMFVKVATGHYAYRAIDG